MQSVNQDGFIVHGVCPTVESAKCRMSIPEQSGDSFDFCVLFVSILPGRGRYPFIVLSGLHTTICTLSTFQSETIAFSPNKNAPPVQSEGALYQNKRF